eukprot:934001-Amphidinium_carterae.1
MDWATRGSLGVFSRREREEERKESPPMPLVRVCFVEVSGNVVGLAPLLELQELNLRRTQVHRVGRAHHAEWGNTHTRCSDKSCRGGLRCFRTLSVAAACHCSDETPQV